MRRFPEPIQNLASAFTKLPGVGSKTSLRYVFELLKMPKYDLEQMARLILDLAEQVKICHSCFTYTQGESLCSFCQDPKRDSRLLCVVETPRDISTIEATEVYQGRYFVLGGTLNPLEGSTPETLHVRALLEKIRASTNIQEIILGFSPDVHGETTMMFLSKQLVPLGRRVTRLARGLPTGATLEFADEITLGDALRGRRET
ncbi:MAG: Recombination protein RecR [Candidatus Uhrbacteria bacterium GW2011_GWF2_41_16]|jgi:recombination protein RecR|uniref:Recombination protein RecR n=2 Tax=Candidatus Uhriibacteriota TaxID=1752732 RepID=A0A0G0VCW8_9BACT|nr:MAG: Recombination protein RecR [Candidatus Uhrbacteria bacterium GW2011_GWC2_41_11]KKR97486.1 MAG: Recombination protein RecR [Candidatus Uhrbacteria bacterium GW2011_GWF2_41_16]HBP00143.1 recombination protein RecR [Candidatus Uhrbacteria bacterium]